MPEIPRRGLEQAAAAAGPELVEWNLVRFGHLLRDMGVRVSSAELLDAVRALGLVDMGSRELVKASLRATMVKSAREVPLFDQAFDRFFVALEERQAQAELARRRREELAARREQARRELCFQGRPLGLTPEQLDGYLRLGEEGQRRLREFLDQSSSGVGVHPGLSSLVESIVRGHLARWLRQENLSFLPGDEDGGLGPPPAVGPDTGLLLYQDLKQLEGPELERALRLARRLARRLASRISRRHRLAPSRGMVDFRRTIRRNLRFGGVPLRLAYRRRRVGKPRLLVVADVSGSMARYSRFVLQFIYGLSRAVGGVEIFAFADDLERLTPAFLGARPFARTMAAVMGQGDIWGGGTDLAQALQTLRSRHAACLTRDRVLLVVSDTKTVKVDVAAAELARIGRMVREVLWLNTLPRARWRDLASVRAFQSSARMYECYTLAHLERVMARQVLG